MESAIFIVVAIVSVAALFIAFVPWRNRNDR